MTDTPAPDPHVEPDANPEAGVGLVPHPLTGEAIDLASLTTDKLAEAYVDVTGPGGLYERVGAFKAALVREATARLDSANSRSERVGNYKLETNAPTVDTYTVEALRPELEQLVDDGVLDAVVLERVIVTPEPVKPSPRVDKREVNKLIKSDNTAVVAAIARARDRQPATRTLKVLDVGS